MFVDISSLSVVDLLRSGALLVAFLATAFADKRGQASVWLKADAVACAGFGLGLYLFPGVFINYMVDGETDVLHIHMTRVVGAMAVVTVAVYYHLAIKDKDNAPLGSWIVSRTLGSAVLFAVAALGANTYGKGSTHFNQKFVSFACFGNLLVFLGYLIHMLRFNDYVNEGRRGTDSARDCTRFHLLVDLLLTFPQVLFVFGFPQTHFDLSGLKADGIHLFLGRMLACQLLPMLLFGIQALQGSNEENRRAFFLVKILGFLSVLPWACYYGYYHNMVPTFTRAFMIHQGLALVALINAFVGAFYRPGDARKRK